MSLHEAIANNSLPLTRKLLDQSNRQELHSMASTGFYPIHQAAAVGSVEIIEYLLDCGAQIEAQTGGFDEERTPLLIAAMNGHLEATKFLIDRGANLNHRDEDDASALLLSTLKGHRGVSDFLIEQGCPLEEREARFYGTNIGEPSSHLSIDPKVEQYLKAHFEISQNEIPKVIEAFTQSASLGFEWAILFLAKELLNRESPYFRIAEAFYWLREGCRLNSEFGYSNLYNSYINLEILEFPSKFLNGLYNEYQDKGIRGYGMKNVQETISQRDPGYSFDTEYKLGRNWKLPVCTRMRDEISKELFFKLCLEVYQDGEVEDYEAEALKEFGKVLKLSYEEMKAIEENATNFLYGSENTQSLSSDSYKSRSRKFLLAFYDEAVVDQILGKMDSLFSRV